LNEKGKMKNKKYIIFLILSMIFLNLINSCKQTSSEAEIYEDPGYLEVPKGFPPIPFPADNPYSLAKVKLGRMLFYEKILSRDSSVQSCSHCKDQSNAFAGNTSYGPAFGGTQTIRNVISIVNSAYKSLLLWDGASNSIEAIAYISLTLPVDLNADTNEMKTRLMGHYLYPKMFKAAFGPNAEPDAYLVAKAIAVFVRTLVSGNSKYDRYVNGDNSVFNESEKRGMDLFFSNKTKCSFCHAGFLFTDGKFHNTGTTTHYFDRGRWYITNDNNDRGKFLTPSLRNVKVTAPYMNDGQFPSLKEVIENYNNGGKLWINKDTIIRPLFLTFQEKSDLIAFLETLTDWTFINDTKFMKP
jgi:cytochrome c peroxidase